MDTVKKTPFLQDFNTTCLYLQNLTMSKLLTAWTIKHICRFGTIVKVVCLGMTSIMVVLNKAKYFSVVTKSQVIHLFQKTGIEYNPIYQSTKKIENYVYKITFIIRNYGRFSKIKSRRTRTREI